MCHFLIWYNVIFVFSIILFAVSFSERDKFYTTKSRHFFAAVLLLEDFREVMSAAQNYDLCFFGTYVMFCLHLCVLLMPANAGLAKFVAR
jgi:hypothetical protein